MRVHFLLLCACGRCIVLLCKSEREGSDFLFEKQQDLSVSDQKGTARPVLVRWLWEAQVGAVLPEPPGAKSGAFNEPPSSLVLLFPLPSSLQPRFIHQPHKMSLLKKTFCCVRNYAHTRSWKPTNPFQLSPLCDRGS